MKILIASIHNLYDNRIGKHINTLINRGYEVSYTNISISSMDSCNFDVNKISLNHINGAVVKTRPIFYFKVLSKLKKHLKNNNYDLLHIHDPLLLPISKIAKKRGCIVIYDRHESYDKMSGVNAKVSSYFEKKYINNISGTIYVNEAQKTHFTVTKPKASAMVSNYQSIFDYNKVVKRKYNGINFIYVGSLSNLTRDVDLLLYLSKMILDKNYNVNFLIGGHTNDKNIIDEIQKISAKYKNFHFFGSVKYSDVIELTLQSDIGLYFTRNVENNINSSPNKIYEYLISGLAIVSTGKFMHKENIDNHCGRVFDYDENKEVIVDFVQTLISSPSLLKKYKENAKNIGEKFTWESQEDRIIELYRKVKEN